MVDGFSSPTIGVAKRRVIQMNISRNITVWCFIISSTVKPCAQNLASPTIKRTSINLTIKYGGLQFLLEFYLLNGLHAFSVELDQVIMKSIEINFFYKSIKQILGFPSWSIGNDA